jgi:hypothetical protein
VSFVKNRPRRYCKFPININEITFTRVSCNCGHARGVTGVMFQLHHCNAKRDADRKLLPLPRKAIFIVARLSGRCDVAHNITAVQGEVEM